MILLILISGLLVSFSFFYLIERRKKAREEIRKANNKEKFRHLRRIVRDAG